MEMFMVSNNKLHPTPQLVATHKNKLMVGKLIYRQVGGHTTLATLASVLDIFHIFTAIWCLRAVYSICMSGSLPIVG